MFYVSVYGSVRDTDASNGGEMAQKNNLQLFSVCHFEKSGAIMQYNGHF